MADSGASGVVDLDNQPNNPLRGLSDPAAAIISLYRHGFLDQKNADHLVASCQESCKSAYSKAKELLSYLGLPGPVTAWLPDIRQLTLRSGRIARLVYRAIAIETTNSILGVQPFKGLNPWAAQNPVPFLIQQPPINDKGQLRVPKVFTLESFNQEFLKCLESVFSSSDARDGGHIYHDRGAGHFDPDHPCKMLQSPEAIWDLADVVGGNFSKVMGAIDPDLGWVIKDELQSACKEAGLAAGYLGVRWSYAAGDERMPLWCIKW